MNTSSTKHSVAGSACDADSQVDPSFRSRKQKKRTPKKQPEVVVKKFPVIVNHTYIDRYDGSIWKRDSSLTYDDEDPNDLPEDEGKWWVPFGVAHIDWAYGSAWDCRGCGATINADSYRRRCRLCNTPREFRNTGKICPIFKAAQEEKERKRDAVNGS